MAGLEVGVAGGAGGGGPLAESLSLSLLYLLVSSLARTSC